MKKTALILIAAIMLSLCACGPVTPEGAVPTVLNTAEYVLYTNIFYNHTGDDYIGDTFVKTGTFAVIEDKYNSCKRYYVWGYNDSTKCCDWQWEFVPNDVSSLPAQGSLVSVRGTFGKSESALDGYWLENAAVTVKTPYNAPDGDMLLTTMSDTLERVQFINMQVFSDEFEGKTVLAYGRIASLDAIEDPYYNGSWSQPISCSGEVPPIGTMVTVRGTYKNGVISDCTVEQTTNY